MRRVLIGLGILGIVGLLAAGVFTAVQLLTPEEEAGEASGATVFEEVIDDGSGNAISVKTIIEPSPELPSEQAAVGGMYLREQDSSYFVGTVDILVASQTVNGVKSITSRNHSGPEVEVVVDHGTVFYEDVTEIDWNSAESAERHFVQELRPIERPAELSEAANLTVWGDKNGDRIVAQIVVISEEH